MRSSPQLKRTVFWTTGLAIAVVTVSLSAWAVPKDTDLSRTEANHARGYAKSLSAAFRQAADDVAPSVVMIRNKPKATAVAERPNVPQFGGPSMPSPFGDLMPNHPELRKFFEQMPSTPRTRPSGMGSGVIIDSSGVILTNKHVVEGGGEITVRLHDDREFVATDVRLDAKTDLAVVVIEGAEDLKAAQLGDSDHVDVGDWVLALGQPFGLEGTVTAGIVSAKGRGIGLTDRENFIQTDAAINPGNSGGPLVNLDGEVIGINTAISSRSGGYQGIGFAVPANQANWVSTQLLEHGTVQRAYLGVIIQPVTHQLAEQFGVETAAGVLVSNVQADTPAAKAGVKAGDVIVKFDGQPVNNPRDLQGMVEKTEIGAKQKLTILRDGSESTINVICQALPADDQVATAKVGTAKKSTSAVDKLGLEVGDLTADVADQLGVDTEHGVVITNVHAGGAAAEAGLKPGMVVVEVNREPVTSIDQFQAALKKQPLDKGVLLLVSDGAASRFFVLKAG